MIKDWRISVPAFVSEGPTNRRTLHWHTKQGKKHGGTQGATGQLWTTELGNATSQAILPDSELRVADISKVGIMQICNI